MDAVDDDDVVLKDDPCRRRALGWTDRNKARRRLGDRPGLDDEVDEDD